MKMVLFGLHIPPEGMNFDTVKTIAITAEQSGFDEFTITDHLYPMGFSPQSDYPLECWTTLAAIATVTDKLKIGPLVTCGLYRNPAILAKMATTVDIISNGRLIFGIGAGWHESEFKAFTGNFPPIRERLDRLEEVIQIIKRMFENEKTSFTGKFYTFSDVINKPRPVQKPHPPIMIGGQGEKRTLKIAATYADIVHLMFNLPVEVLRRKIEVLKNHCKKVGRDFSEIMISESFFVVPSQLKEFYQNLLKFQAEMLGMSIEEVKEGFPPLDADADQYVKFMQPYIDLGVSIFPMVFMGTPATQKSMIEFFGKDVISIFK
jgi:F420-dependent oxidoreductase-like protein